MAVTLGALAVRFGCELKGSPDVEVESVATLQNAGARSVSFLANPKYRRQLADTRAAAVVLEPKFADAVPAAVSALLSDNPYATYARIATLLHPQSVSPPGIHPGAFVHSDAQVAASASIGPGAVVDAGAKIGERVSIGPGCIVMHDAQVGEDTRLVAKVTL